MNLKGFGLAALSVMLLGGTAWAHHSNAHFDQENPMTLKGEVVEYHLVNPHAFVYLNVTDENGQTTEWALQTGGNVGRLIRANWSQDSLKPGDTITAVFGPQRDGTPNGLLISVELPDGTVLGAR